jgi:hypothetical protein
MAINNTDKLLVGRGDTSYQVSLADSGLAKDSDKVSKSGDQMQGRLNFTGNGLIDGKNATSLSGRAGLEIQCSGEKPLAISNSGSYQETIAIYGYVNGEPQGRGKNMTIGAQGNVNTKGFIKSDAHVAALELRSTLLNSGQNSNLTIQRNGETRILVGSESVTMHKPVRLTSNAQPIDDDHVVTKAYVDAVEDNLSGGMAVPTGAIMFWGHAADVPSGWMVLDGGDFDITNYSRLHDILSQNAGYQSGKLPDYRDRFVCGIGTKHTGEPGAKLGELTKRPATNFTTNSQTLSHSHGFTMNHSHTLTVTGTTNTAGGHSHTYSAWTSSAKGGGTGTSNPNSRSTSLTTGTAGAHSHTVSVTGTVGTYTSTTKTTATSTLTHSHTITGGGDTVNRPLTIVGYWIIKT